MPDDPLGRKVGIIDFWSTSAVPATTSMTANCSTLDSRFPNRRILHFNCTAHPNGDWIVQQLRDALPLPCRYRYMLFDHDAKFGEVVAFLNPSGIEPLRTSVRSPWQNGTAERWVGSARREMFDHTIPLNESHLRHLGREYLAYYHEDRTHLGLAKATPAHRAIEQPPTATSRIHSQPRVGGLHHRYGWTAAA